MTSSPTDAARVELRQVPAELVDELEQHARTIATLDLAVYGLDSPAARHPGGSRRR